MQQEIIIIFIKSWIKLYMKLLINNKLISNKF